ncbi:sulfate/molybdate ABC transporter ATP-binding protein [Deltaproteobacteria bacterium TL4]
MEITINNIQKNFSSVTALDNINLTINSGELIALLGPSGSGKTTLLRIIAGLEFPDMGTVCFEGLNRTSTPLQERKIGFVFQNYALFKHMTVSKNISFGLRVMPRKDRLNKAMISQRVQDLLNLVQLGGMGERYPHQLSGGQRQRVALARALAIEPKIMLLDEPFGALDAKVRKELRQWVRELHQKTGVTTVFVTHDQEEALEMADKIVIMDHGKIAQIGTVDEVYEKPNSPMVFDFLGSTNIIPAALLKQGLRNNDDAGPYLPPEALDIYVRPNDLRIASPDDPGIDVVVLDVHRTGPIVRATVVISGSREILTVELPHLHHDVSYFLPEASLKLRLMQFSVFQTKDRLMKRLE